MFIEHVNLTVSDLAWSREFYRKLFGLEVRWEGTTTDDRPAVHIGDDRQYIALFQAASPGVVANEYSEVGMNHFAFIVDDLDAMKARLASLGVTPKAEMDYEPGRRLYFFDPDGMEVELVAYDGPST